MTLYRPRGKRFTIYDQMEERGVFAANPANADSQNEQGEPLYKGPVEYPKMLYHPHGELYVAIPAMPEVTPFGPRMLNEQKRLITKVIGSKEEELEALQEGWHDHPQKAHQARKDWEAQHPQSDYTLGDTTTMAETIRRMQQQMWEMQMAGAKLQPSVLSDAERKELEELRALRAAPAKPPLSFGKTPPPKPSVDLAPDSEEGA